MIPLRDASPTRRTPVVTLGLIALCTITFGYELVVMAQGGEAALDRLFETRGVVPAELVAAVTGGNWLSRPVLDVFTSMFLHAGWLHLLGNLLFLWIFGANVEDRVGRARFLLVYLAGGVVAVVAQTLADPGSTAPMIGASGAIAAHLQGVEPERPLTHDLFAAVLRETHVRLDRVLISGLAEATFHARLVLVTADARHEVDARPSDAIALAIRLEAPIYAAGDVLDRAAALPEPDDEDEDDDEDEAPQGSPRRATRSGTSPSETTGEPVDPARLHIFRDFVNSLDPDADARGGSQR